MELNIVEIVIKVVLAAGTAFFLYRDARARDYSWLMWTIVPIIIFFTPGIFGALFSLVLIAVIYTATRPKGILKPCPHCKKKIHTILAFCPFCKQPVKKECLRCHETVDWDAVVCPHCRSRNLTDS